MDLEKVIEQIELLKKALEEIEKRLGQSEVPRAVLEDFKMAVDHTRMTVWALLSSADADEYEVASQIVRFRVKRAAEMFKCIRSDIDTSELTVDAPELQEFYSELKSTLDRLERLFQSGT